MAYGVRRAATAGCASTFLICACAAFAQVPWRTGTSAPSGRTETEALALLNQSGLRGAASRLVVRFDAPITPEQRARLEGSGLKLLAYLHENAYFARVNAARLDTSAIAAAATLADAFPIQTEWKLHPMLAAGEIPTWAVLPPDAFGPAGPAAEPWISAYVLFHPDVTPAEAQAVAAAHQVEVREQLQTMNMLWVDLPLSGVAALAADDAVQYVEPAMPPMGMFNAENRALTGANEAQDIPYELDGSGIIVLVYDGASARASHVDFGGRLTVMDSTSMHVHPTHVAGTIGGSGEASGGLHRGMAPGVTMLSYGLELGGGSGTMFVTNPGDIEADYIDAVVNFGAMISNNSIGLNTAQNGFSCSLNGDYTLVTALIDGIVRGNLGAPFRVVWANGNERGAVSCGTSYRTVPPPATAKNQLAVGALNANDDSMTNFSSWGPTDDGRLRPDVAAPGCQSNGDNGVTSTAEDNDTDYETYCGTSMASPTVCGLAALLLEDYRNLYPLLPLPRNSTLRAIFAHTAVDRGNVGPDYQFGYGSVRIVDAIELLRAGHHLENSLIQGEAYVRQVIVTEDSGPLKITIAWDDYPGTPNVNPALVNDLDLRVWSPSGVRHYPWTLTPASPGNPAVRTQEDHLNNIEQVVVDDPEPGVWTVEVYGTNVPQGPQSFSMTGIANVQTGIIVAGGMPEMVPPGEPLVLDVDVVSLGEAVEERSPRVRFRFGDGEFLSEPMVHLSGTTYRATIPGGMCGQVPEVYFSAAGTTTGGVTLPADAPANTYTYEIGLFAPVFVDDFEQDLGWTASGVFSDGAWERGIPRNWGRADPPADFDGSGQCYLTDNDQNSSNSDIDGGTVILTSPVINATGRVRVSYAWWLNDLPSSQIGVEDSFRLEIATDEEGADWQEVRRYTTALGLWRTELLETPADFAGSATTRFRFLATDADPGDVIEAALDAFSVTVFTCEYEAEPSCADGVLNQGEERVDCGGPCQPCACLSDAECDDGASCNGTEFCGAYGQCVSTRFTCDVGEWCNGAADRCDPHGIGDIDEDGDLDLADFARLQACFGDSAAIRAECASCNLTGADGVIDLADFAAFAAEMDAAAP